MLKFPSDCIETSDYSANSATHRLKGQNTHSEVRVLEEIVRQTRARHVFFGLRGNTEGEPHLTVAVHAGNDAYIADQAQLNVQRANREDEVRRLATSALDIGSALVAATTLIVQTASVRPEEARMILDTQAVIAVGSVDELVSHLKNVAGI